MARSRPFWRGGLVRRASGAARSRPCDDPAPIPGAGGGPGRLSPWIPAPSRSRRASAPRRRTSASRTRPTTSSCWPPTHLPGRGLVHEEPLRRPERDAEPAARRRRPPAGLRRGLEERQRRHRARTVTPTPPSWPRAWQRPRLDPADVLVASTGVIGRPYPMERIRAPRHLAAAVRRPRTTGRHAPS